MQNRTLDVLFAGILLACFTDLCRFKLWGNDYTYSFQLLKLEADHPFFGLAIVYTLMTLAGHLTLPALQNDPPLREWAGIIIGLVPIAGFIGFLAFHPQGSACASCELRKLLSGGGWYYFTLLHAAAVLGLLNGKINVRQHV